MVERFFFFLSILAIILGFDISVQYLLDFLDHPPPISLAMTLAFYVVDIFLFLGAIKISLKIIDKKKATLNDLFSCYDKVLKQLLAELLYILIIMGGLVLFIVPAFIWMVKYQFISYLIVDKDMGPVEALRASAEITEGIKWRLFIFDMLVLLINMAGAMLFFVGVFFTIPTTTMAMSMVYRDNSPSKKQTRKK